MQIRKANIIDLPTLLTVSRQTFVDAYAHLNNPLDFSIYLEDQFNLSCLQSQIENLNSYFYLLSENHKDIAYLKLNIGSAQTENRFENALEIERIYVLKEHQNKRLGGIMINHAIKQAQKRGLKNVWLGVWEINASAIAFYKRHQFNIVGTCLLYTSPSPRDS